MSSHYPFLRMTALAAAAFVLLTPATVQPLQAQAEQRAALSGDSKAEASKPESAKPTETPAAGGANSGKVTAVDQGNPAQKNLATKAIEKAREVAKSAGDIFARVPCQSHQSVSGGRSRTGRPWMIFATLRAPASPSSSASWQR